VFQEVPHAEKAGSGVPAHSQHQRLDAGGRQVHNGQRIRSKAFSLAGPSRSSVIRLGIPASRNQTRQALSTFAADSLQKQDIGRHSARILPDGQPAQHRLQS
jgi:hypothetical protein